VETQSPRRQCKREALNGDTLNLGEAVVNVGFVSDPDQAKVLSWAAGNFMRAMIAPDTASYRKLLAWKQSAFNADTIPAFQCKGHDGQLRERNDEEKLQGKLPLQFPLHLEHDASEWPKYAVNMIDLPLAQVCTV
jgi:hypothetical protein